MKHYLIKHFYFPIKSTVPVWMNTFVLHCKQYKKCLRLSDLSRDGMLHWRISCYCWSSGDRVCENVCENVWECFGCWCECVGVFIVATIPYSWFNAVNRLTFDNSRNMWKHFGLENFSPRNFCIWFILLKRLPYFIQYLYSTSHCATATDIWSFYYNIVRRLCSSKSQYFYRQWILHWICSRWDQPL